MASYHNVGYIGGAAIDGIGFSICCANIAKLTLWLSSKGSWTK